MNQHEDTKTQRPLGEVVEDLARLVVDSAMCIHRELGPGLLEGLYEEALAIELSERGISLQRQLPVPVLYRGHTLQSPLRLDMVVADSIILELKAIESILPVHKAQLLSYLRMKKKRLGLLINFHVPLLKNGIFRIIN